MAIGSVPAFPRGDTAQLSRLVVPEGAVRTRAGDPARDASPEARRAEIRTAQTLARFGVADARQVPATAVTVRHGDTLEALATRYGTTVDQLARLNPDVHNLDDLRVGQTLNVPTNRQVVQVQPGDTLTAIADRYGVDVAQLAAANGIADPDSIQAGQRIAIVPRTPVGLDRDAEVRGYIADMQAIRADWPNLTAAQRLERVEAALNERLAAAGVPPIRLTAGADGNASGVYDFTTHSIGVDADLLNQPRITDDQLRGLADTVYHEGRHAEQWFDMARVRIAQGQDVGELGLPDSVIAAARDAPRLDPASAHGRFVTAMYDSVYGAGGADRNDVLGRLNDGDDDVYELYRALPEEADAWRVGGKVENLWPRS
ncbi:hypothetical protein ASG29_11510 [Sphingomonas sp. Leaf412]|uniref:LysM peptidoglycan-binding domain-containing protein n=1 Tax=Sphingomonas sp. Leaf412 TaxID=1736370 RepID=UPI0006F63E5C|nr:LysM peptidoglycan-binding domain-containing protein [Sphingomonas sp. Leaf412]KQT32408.1 hypothetical protein ASG29_11510 [Sphingomonas sp. Leaf412]